MMHTKRVWRVVKIESLEELAHKLTGHTWTCRTGFECKSLLFLNDSTSEDGAQEYAIVRHEEQGFVQIESITFSWCDEATALEYINQLVEYDATTDPIRKPVMPTIETPETHGRCSHCA